DPTRNPPSRKHPVKPASASRAPSPSAAPARSAVENRSDSAPHGSPSAPAPKPPSIRPLYAGSSPPPPAGTTPSASSQPAPPVHALPAPAHSHRAATRRPSTSTPAVP